MGSKIALKNAQDQEFSINHLDNAGAIAINSNDISKKSEIETTIAPYNKGFKNYIINGGFDVWQRGTSFSGSSEYTADRWKAQIAGDVGTKNKSTNVPTGYKYALNLAITGSASFTQIGQHIEFVNFKGLCGKTATLSFWVKANNTNISAMTYRIRYSTNLEDETILFTGSTLVSGSKTVSTNWQQHTTSFVVPTGTTSMTIEFSTGAVSNGDIFYITGVQLEEGSVATPFEQRPYGLELLMCKRYYGTVSFYARDDDAMTNGTRGVYSPYPVNPRVIPTIGVISVGHVNSNNLSAYHHDNGIRVTWVYETVGPVARDVGATISYNAEL